MPASPSASYFSAVLSGSLLEDTPHHSIILSTHSLAALTMIRVPVTGYSYKWSIHGHSCSRKHL